MEVDTTRQTVKVNKLVNSKKDIILIEGDIIVPDVKPDILSTIDTTGNVCIYKKELMDGKIRFDGSINLNVIYLADSEDDFIRSLNNSLDFSQIINIDKCMAGMDIKDNFIIKNIECKVLNGRKINVKVMLELELYVYSNEEISVLQDINNVDDVQTLNSNIKINNLVGNGTCRAFAKDTITLEDGDELGEILKTEINLSNKEIKTSYNKVLLKADSNVKIMYLSEDKQIKTISATIPIMGFIDINDVSENNILSSNYEIKNILIKPNVKEQHSIYVEIEYEIYCDATDAMELRLIQDMYSPAQDIQFDQKGITAIANKKITRNVCNIKNNISVPEISGNQIYDVKIVPNITNNNILNGRIIYEGELELTFLFVSNNNYRMDTKKYNLSFTFSVEDDDISQNNEIHTQINILDDNFVIESNNIIECNINLEFELEMHNDMNINVIDKIEVNENENHENPSIVIYIVKAGDTLWNIARKYKTTIQSIVEVNNLADSNNLEIGQKLYIPRYNKTKIA